MVVEGVVDHVISTMVMTLVVVLMEGACVAKVTIHVVLDLAPQLVARGESFVRRGV